MKNSPSSFLSRPLIPVFGVLIVAAFASRDAAEGRSLLYPHDELLSDRAEIDRDLASSLQPATLWLERASIQRELHDWDGALVDLARAARAGASPAEVAFATAEVHLASGDQKRAEEAATAALKERPENGSAHLVRAEARVALGLFQLASDDYGRALGLAPARPLDVVSAWANALASDPNAGPSEAVRLLDQEIEARGPLAALVLQAVEYERQLGARGDAMKRLVALRETGWSEVQFRLLAGDLEAEAGHQAEALTHWRAGIAALEQRSPRRRTTRAGVRDLDALQSRLARRSR